jgi:hypothetical protein
MIGRDNNIMSIQLLDAQCQHCQTLVHFKIGHDENEDTLAQAIDHFQGKTQIQIRSLLKKHTMNHSDYGFSLFVCSDCQRVYNPFTVTIEYDDIMLFKPFHQCQQCHITLLPIKPDDIEQCHCSHCGEKQLTHC